MTKDGVVRRRLDLEAEARGELDGAHHAHGVLAEADIRIADHAHATRFEVVEAADVVDHREVGDVVEQPVDREVAAPRVLQRRAERVVVGDQQLFGVSARSGSRRNVATSTIMS